MFVIDKDDHLQIGEVRPAAIRENISIFVKCQFLDIGKSFSTSCILPLHESMILISVYASFRLENLDIHCQFKDIFDVYLTKRIDVLIQHCTRRLKCCFFF